MSAVLVRSVAMGLAHYYAGCRRLSSRVRFVVAHARNDWPEVRSRARHFKPRLKAQSEGWRLTGFKYGELVRCSSGSPRTSPPPTGPACFHSTHQQPDHCHGLRRDQQPAVLSRAEELTGRVASTRTPKQRWSFRWVAQATGLCRAATRRSERGGARTFSDGCFHCQVLSVPSGQWPDGTGGSPVPPIPTPEFGFNLRCA